MKSKFFYLCLLLLSLSLPFDSAAREIPPLVTPAWLMENLANPRIVILDVRKVEDYREGHIPGAVNLFYGAWTGTKQGLDCELPPKDDLADAIRYAGITENSLVVLVGTHATQRDRVNVTRTAWTLECAGINNLAIMDGGYELWVSQNRPVTRERKRPVPSNFNLRLGDCFCANKKGLLQAMKTAVLVDTRPERLFTGEIKPPELKRAGHIPGAVNLPHELVFQPDGRFRPEQELREMGSSKIGKDLTRRIIVLCCDGRFASSWWYVIKEILGYRDVCIYDGSMEEWCKDLNLPLETGK